MKIKDNNKIDDNTWLKLKKGFKLMVFGTPFMVIVFSFLAWVMTDNLIWMLVPTIPWVFVYLFGICTCISFFKYSRHTLLMLSLLTSLCGYFFLSISSACVFQLFGPYGIVIQILIGCFMGYYVSSCCYKYWDKVWESHRSYNENEAIDLKNGRYDLSNNFNMDERIVKGGINKKYSNPALMSLVVSISPMGVGIGMMLYRGQQFTVASVLVGSLGFITAFGILKYSCAIFYMYRKLAYYEKQIGKPIINGLL